MTTTSGAMPGAVSEYSCGGGYIHPSPCKPVLERRTDDAVSFASIAVALLSYRQLVPLLAILRQREEFLPDRYQPEVQFGTGSVESMFVDGDDD